MMTTGPYTKQRQRHLVAERDRLRAENARLQERVEEAERERDEWKELADGAIAAHDTYKARFIEVQALAERRKEALERGVNASNGWSANDGMLQPIIDWQADARAAIKEEAT